MHVDYPLPPQLHNFLTRNRWPRCRGRYRYHGYRSQRQANYRSEDGAGNDRELGKNQVESVDAKCSGRRLGRLMCGSGYALPSKPRKLPGLCPSGRSPEIQKGTLTVGQPPPHLRRQAAAGGLQLFCKVDER